MAIFKLLRSCQVFHIIGGGGGGGGGGEEEGKGKGCKVVTKYTIGKLSKRALF